MNIVLSGWHLKVHAPNPPGSADFLLNTRRHRINKDAHANAFTIIEAPQETSASVVIKHAIMYTKRTKTNPLPTSSRPR